MKRRTGPNRDIVALLLERGATVRSLRAAAGLGQSELVDVFFDGGALTPTARPIRSPLSDTVPADVANDPAAIIDNAFVMAVNRGQLRTAKQLYGLGARVDEKPPGYRWHGTASYAAAWRGDAELVRWLMSIGADPHIRDGLANSDATGWANHHGHHEIAELLHE